MTDILGNSLNDRLLFAVPKSMCHIRDHVFRGGPARVLVGACLHCAGFHYAEADFDDITPAYEHQCAGSRALYSDYPMGVTQERARIPRRATLYTTMNPVLTHARGPT